VGAVVDPIARSRDPLTGGNACGMANHGHDVTMPTRPGAQNAEAVLGIMVGYALAYSPDAAAAMRASLFHNYNPSKYNGNPSADGPIPSIS
jgi:hypothetical protein